MTLARAFAVIGTLLLFVFYGLFLMTADFGFFISGLVMAFAVAVTVLWFW